MGVYLRLVTDREQANKEVNATIKEIQKNAKIKLGVQIDDKEAKALIKEHEKMQAALAKSAKNVAQRDRSTELAQAKAINKALEQEYRLQQQIAQLPQKRINAQNDFTTWLKENPKAMRAASDQVQILQSNIQNATTPEQFTRATTAVTGFKKEMQAAGNVGRTAFGEIGNMLTKFGSWIMAGTVVMGAINNFRQMITNVKELDSSMVELRKVTDLTESTYAKFMDTASRSAKAVGSSVSEFINATADFARLGFNLQDATQLANVSSVYKNVGDGITDIGEASQSIISTLKAFNIEASDSIKIVDMFNAVGNNFAISSKGVGDALLRSASSLATANNTVEESIGLITAANAVVQDPEKVGRFCPAA